MDMKTRGRAATSTRNIPDAKIPRQPHTRKEIAEAESRASRVGSELLRGLEFIEQYKKSVTFFGSARMGERHPYYKKARSLAEKLSGVGFTIVTGGGPGIMEAANRGAHDASGQSLGLTIQLPHEERANPYVTRSVDFYYFFTRKVTMSFAAEAYIFFPGGFGTFDELFEILTLVQTHKIESVPVILFGKAFWKPLDRLLTSKLADEYKTIDRRDTSLYTITDNEDDIVEIVRKAPIRNG